MIGRSRATRARRNAAQLLLALCAACCVLAWAVQARAEQTRQGWWLQIRDAACVQGPKVLLGDIALPQGDMPAAQWKDLAARPLWDAPERPGRQTAFSRERLAAMLRHYAPDMADASVLPSQLVLQRGGKVIPGAEMTRLIVDYLTAKGKAFDGELEIRDMQGPDAIFLTSERDRVEIAPSSPVKPGRVNLLFEVKAGDGKVLRRYAASAFVSVWKALPCPVRPLNRLETLDLARVQFKRKNLAYNEDAWDGTGGPWRMVRSVGVDEVIRRSDLEPVPVIAKGSKVNLVFEGEHVHLNVKAEALADGGVGQAIQVRNLQSNRKITAVVQDASTVVVR